MKGPYERLKYVVRRVWECPLCKHRERTEGGVTFEYCRCQKDVPTQQQVCMNLVKDGVRRTTRASDTQQASGGA